MAGGERAGDVPAEERVRGRDDLVRALAVDGELEQRRQQVGRPHRRRGHEGRDEQGLAGPERQQRRERDPEERRLAGGGEPDEQPVERLRAVLDDPREDVAVEFGQAGRHMRRSIRSRGAASSPRGACCGSNGLPMNACAPRSSAFPRLLDLAAVHDHLDRVDAVALLDAVQHLPPVHLGHHHVEEDQVGRLVVERCETLAGTRSLAHRIALRLEVGSDELPQGRVVVDDEDGRTACLLRPARDPRPGEERLEVGALEATMAAGRVEGRETSGVRPLAHGRLCRTEKCGSLAEGEPLSTVVRPPSRVGGLQLSVALHGHGPQSKKLPNPHISLPGLVASLGSAFRRRDRHGALLRLDRQRLERAHDRLVPPGSGALSSARPIARPATKTTARTARRKIQAAIRRPDDRRGGRPRSR